MPMFSKLFEILPDAEQLLSLEPKDLAGPLLVSLEDSEQIKPNEVIEYASMKHAIQGYLEQKYPPNCHNKVLYALMEAWQWLEREGFVTPMPTSIAGFSTTATYGTQYFISRRGEKIQTLEDFEAYRKADLLSKHQLHPIIAEKVWFIFSQGSYGTAVLEAFKQVEVAVRNAGGYETRNYGVPLMWKAFDENNGNLTDPSQSSAVRKAKAHLFAGAIGLYKNPSSHQDVEFAPEEAAEIIIVASHLLRLVDECEQINANSST